MMLTSKRWCLSTVKVRRQLWWYYESIKHHHVGDMTNERKTGKEGGTNGKSTHSDRGHWEETVFAAQKQENLLASQLYLSSVRKVMQEMLQIKRTEVKKHKSPDLPKGK